ncbi:hypothetical protein B4064_0214 [Caldibacillus thermoamylovorans]|uniref:Uncharacterized protein n=1 Tax=Caldibacillus thermoamylovorans TaxID=35841 RepID=A0A0D0FS76_9BACI|nr:hypothetical protein B4064_0214 [Caldibacillus thermoamylovorans]KIO64996.1 hypothetical protein B4065_0268 [Caldibacillus thermoamylovorans]KIO69217.1 hypothetical protein B4166_1937 [Caldibacillus thermoamylovorans]KIO70061.1 hypothetical protein B4167_0751 [Caldibacillus thermoamylovorans]
MFLSILFVGIAFGPLFSLTILYSYPFLFLFIIAKNINLYLIDAISFVFL